MKPSAQQDSEDRLYIARRLVAAASEGDAEGVREALMAGADPKTNHSIALRKAAEGGHSACVDLLLPVSDPREYHSYALRWASAYGHVACVHRLLPVSDPQAEGSDALRWAAGNGHIAVVELLAPVSNVAQVRERLLAQGCAEGIALLDEISLKSGFPAGESCRRAGTGL